MSPTVRVRVCAFPNGKCHGIVSHSTQGQTVRTICTWRVFAFAKAFLNGSLLNFAGNACLACLLLYFHFVDFLGLGGVSLLSSARALVFFFAPLPPFSRSPLRSPPNLDSPSPLAAAATRNRNCLPPHLPSLLFHFTLSGGEERGGAREIDLRTAQIARL